MSAIRYIIEVMVCSGLFLVAYRWLLAKKVSFAICRAFIIASMLLAAAIPAMNVPVFPEKTFTQQTILTGYDFLEQELDGAAGTGSAVRTEASDGIDVGTEQPKNTGSIKVAAVMAVQVIYILVALASIGLTIYNAIKIQRLRRRSRLTRTEEYTLAEHEDIKTPFSFLMTIFMGFNYEPQERLQILTHEASHVRHRHSFERVALSVLRSIFWFNPFFWMAEKALEEVQEWEADKDVLNEGYELRTYRTTIFKQLFGYNPDITCGLNHSLTKQRFIMMTQSRRGKGAWIRLAATLPIIAAVFLAFGCGTKEAKASDEVSTDLTNGTEATYIDICPPCDATASNSFGAGGTHTGIDYVLNEGDPVYAAADGEILAVTRDDSNGLMLVLKHTDGIETRYAHLSKVAIVSHIKIENNSSPVIKVNSVYNLETDADHSGWTISGKVHKGQLIGYAGSTGRATGPHLHFEMRKDGEPVDPARYFTSDRPAKGPFHIYVVEGTNKPGEEYFAICEGRLCKINEEISQAVGEHFASGLSPYSSVLLEVATDVPSEVADMVRELLRKASVSKINLSSYRPVPGEITVLSDRTERIEGLSGKAKAKVIQLDIQKAGIDNNRLSDTYTMTLDGQRCTKEEVKDIVTGKIAADSSIDLIQISADPQTPMGYIDDLKKELRGIEGLRIYLTMNNTATPNHPATKMKKDEFYGVETINADRKNVLIIKTNATDRYLILTKPRYLDEDTLREMKKAILNKEGDPDYPESIDQTFILPDGSSYTYPVTQAMVVMQHDRGTSFDGYQKVNEFVQRAYRELRDELAGEVFGKPLAGLSDAEMQIIYQAVPMNVSELAPKDAPARR